MCVGWSEAGQLLHDHELPPQYRVAVVGRFKVGKSSFVNELLGAKLASEDTSPETAAVTLFRHSRGTSAKVNFIPREKWREIQALFAEDSKNPEAHRIRSWVQFDAVKARATHLDPGVETFDLAMLEREYLRDGGHAREIELF